MLNRRNVRVKLMQLLYAQNMQPDYSKSKLIGELKKQADKGYHLYLFLLYNFDRISAGAEKDYSFRNSKHLLTEYDKSFTPRFNNNIIISAIRRDKEYQRLVKTLRFEELVDNDIIAKVYRLFSTTDAYKEYILGRESIESSRKVYIDLLKFVKRNELFDGIISDYYTYWLDDEDNAFGAIKKTIKCLPECINFMEDWKPNKLTIEDFGFEMIELALDRNKEIEEKLFPLFDNWDPSRVAIIDMMILKLAVIELMFFPSIPVKVTLNEYVDIAKAYSTDKSKEFVNGILDRFMKKYAEEGSISKEGRGLIDK